MLRPIVAAVVLAVLAEPALAQNNISAAPGFNSDYYRTGRQPQPQYRPQQPNTYSTQSAQPMGTYTQQYFAPPPSAYGNTYNRTYNNTYGVPR